MLKNNIDEFLTTCNEATVQLMQKLDLDQEVEVCFIFSNIKTISDNGRSFKKTPQ